MPIDPNLPFTPVGIALLCVSDSRTMSQDKSGDLLAQRLQACGHRLVTRSICKDDSKPIAEQLRFWSQHPDIQTIITSGGTGVTGRDVTPEACLSLGGKEIPGFGELFRLLSYNKIGTSAVQSRALAVAYNGIYIFALPGSPSACKDAWDGILATQLDSRHRPCNFVELLGRLQEH